jgi:hypothetical protein
MGPKRTVQKAMHDVDAPSVAFPTTARGADEQPAGEDKTRPASKPAEGEREHPGAVARRGCCILVRIGCPLWTALVGYAGGG